MDNFDNMYKKGIETRSRVITASKKLFYQHGYNNTTINMIKEEANVSLSTIPYYFNKKDEIIKVIYREFVKNVHDFLDQIITEKIDTYLKHFYASKIYYYIILNDENNKRFYYEVSVCQSNYQLLHPFIDKLHEDYARDFNIPITPKELKMIRMTDAGGRREILYDYYNGLIDMSVDELINYVVSVPATLIGIDKSISQKYGELSTEFVKSLDYSHIKFLDDSLK